MRVYPILFLVLQAVVFIEAADPPNSIKWTLHKSCYRNKEDTADDNDLADAMIKTVDNVKAWANRGAQKLDDSISLNPFKGAATKDAMMPLIGSNGYKDRAKDVINKFKSLEKLDGPIGKDGNDGEKYDRSNAWRDLENSDAHWWDFVIICRPELMTVKDISGILDVPYDVVRQYRLPYGHDTEKMVDQENFGYSWEEVTGAKILAVVVRESMDPPEAGRRHIPEAITFHPLWLNYQRDMNWEGWTAGMFDQVTAKTAPEAFKVASEGKDFDLRPVDGLLDSSFTRNLFHEMFHLTAFGRLLDDPAGAYRWANNVKYKNLENPDLLATIAVVIELLNRGGDQYKVSEEGAVSPR